MVALSATLWLYNESVRQSMTFFFSAKVMPVFFQSELLMSFSKMSSLISSWYFARGGRLTPKMGMLFKLF